MFSTGHFVFISTTDVSYAHTRGIVERYQRCGGRRVFPTLKMAVGPTSKYYLSIKLHGVIT